MELWLPTDDELGDLGGQEDAGHDVGLALALEPVVDHDELPQKEEDAGDDEVHPKVRAVEDQQDPEGQVEDVGEVEHL